MLYASKNEGKQSLGYILLKYFFFSLFFFRKMSEIYFYFLELVIDDILMRFIPFYSPTEHIKKD